MRIQRLDLIAFGPFTDQSLDFGDGRGLHLVLGENEAGKSSTLRALRDFLFGIPAQSTDSFVHAYSDLRIGATLADGDEQCWQLIRRKGAKNTLLEADGGSPADARRFETLLGGVTPALFSQLFGLGHDQLVAGGREFISGDGALGPILFSASAGIANLQTVQKQLDADAAKLFKPRASNPSLNARITAVNDARKKMRDLQVPSTRWQTHDKNLQQAQQRLAEIDRQLQSARQRKRRSENAQAALPLIVERRELVAQLVQLGDVRVLPDDFGRRRQAAQIQSARDREAESQHAARLKQIDEAAAKLPLDETLAAEADQIDRLRESLGAYSEGRNDTPGLKGEHEQLTRDAARQLRELRPDLALADVDRLRLSKTQQADIQRLARSYQALVDDLERGKQSSSNSQAEIAHLEKQLAEIPPSSDQSLADVLQRWQSQGDLEQQRSAEQTELAAAVQQAEIDVARLGLKDHSLAEIEKLPLPPAETIDRFAREFAELEKKRALLADKLAGLDSDAEKLKAQIDQIQAAGAVPSEDDLQAARQLRQSGWQLVLADWKKADRKAGPTPLEIAAFTNKFADADLPDAFEASVRAADDVVDRLRREADRVQTIAGLTARQVSVAEARQQQSQQLADADAHMQQLQNHWQQLWQPIGISALPPGEMRPWLAQHQRLVEQSQAIRKQQAVIGELQKRIDAGVRELQMALHAGAVKTLPSDLSLARLLQEAQTAVRRADQLARKREQLSKQLEDACSQLQSQQQSTGRAAEKLDAWRAQWSAAIAPLGLPADALPEQASAVLDEIKELFDKLKEAADKQQRIAGIASRGQAFEIEVRRLCERVAPDISLGDVSSAVEQLLTRLKQAASSAEKHEQWNRQRQECQAELEAAQSRLSQAAAELQMLCQEAGCKSAEELLPAESKSSDYLKLRGKLDACDKQLRQLSDGVDLATFVSAAEQVDASSLPDEIAAAKEQLDQLEEQKAQLNEQIGAEKGELRRIDGNASAATEAELLQQQLAALEAEVEQFVRLRLATAVLREGIERFRERNQGPALDRAGQIFSQLTRGSFAGLQVDYESEQPVLVGLRGEPVKRIKLNEMSDGTGDQLYLALRLAMLEQHLTAHAAMPVVLDDILVNFDDARSSAALKVLADFAAQSQVIYFTHHEHLVKLAQKELKNRVQVHQLVRAGQPMI